MVCWLPLRLHSAGTLHVRYLRIKYNKKTLMKKDIFFRTKYWIWVRVNMRTIDPISDVVVCTLIHYSLLFSSDMNDQIPRNVWIEPAKHFISSIFVQKVKEINRVLIKIIVNKTARENRCVEPLKVLDLLPRTTMISNSKNHPTKCWPPTNKDARALIDRMPLIHTNVERPFSDSSPR